MTVEKRINALWGPDALLAALKQLKHQLATGSIRLHDQAAIEADARAIQQELARDMPNLGSIKRRATDLAARLNQCGLQAASHRTSDSLPPLS
jgi:hypothetical protein